MDPRLTQAVELGLKAKGPHGSPDGLALAEYAPEAGFRECEGTPENRPASFLSIKQHPLL